MLRFSYSGRFYSCFPRFVQSRLGSLPASLSPFRSVGIVYTCACIMRVVLGVVFARAIATIITVISMLVVRPEDQVVAMMITAKIPRGRTTTTA